MYARCKCQTRLTTRALTLAFEQTEQSALGSVQVRSSVIDQIFKSLKVLVDYISAIEAIENLRRNIRRSANCGRVSEDFRCLLYRLNHFLLFAARRLSRFAASARKRTGANQCSGPRPKVLRGKRASHHFSNVLIDSSSSYIDETIAVFVIENSVVARS